jgi:hypothetical protein
VRSAAKDIIPPLVNGSWTPVRMGTTCRERAACRADQPTSAAANEVPKRAQAGPYAGGGRIGESRCGQWSSVPDPGCPTTEARALQRHEACQEDDIPGQSGSPPVGSRRPIQRTATTRSDDLENREIEERPGNEIRRHDERDNEYWDGLES